MARFVWTFGLLLSFPLSAWAQTAAEAPAAKPKAPPAKTDQFFDSDGVRIHYIEQGEGPPVILVHGFTANIDFNWRMPGIYDALAKDYRVIALDNRGHGLSDKPHDPAAYGPEMCEDVVRLMDHLQIDKAHVIGYSMGGFITNKLLTLHPDRVASATLGGAGWSQPGDELNGFLDELATALDEGRGIGPLIKRLTPEGQEPPTDEQINNLNGMVMLGNDPKALAAVARGMKQLTVTADQLKANRIPTLAVIGEVDPLKVGVDALAGVMNDVDVVVIPQADHMTAVTDPKFVEALKGFLAKQTDQEPAESPAGPAK